MKLAICGYLPLAVQIIEDLRNVGVTCTHFIKDLISNLDETEFQIPTPPLSLVNFFEFRRLIESGKIDGLIIVEIPHIPFVIEVVKLCKLYNIPNVGVMDPLFLSYINEIRYLNSDKAFIPQLEANIIDSCNLNCKGCAHYSNLFDDSEIYPLNEYERDIKQIARNADILNFYILGGEPLKLKNLDEYLRITKRFLPNTNLRLITNGLLVPSVSQKSWILCAKMISRLKFQCTRQL